MFKHYMNLYLSVIIFFCFLSKIDSQTLPLPLQWKKSIVPIELHEKTPANKDTFIIVGTGFLVKNNRGLAFIITCRHVVNNIPNAWITFRVKGQKATISRSVGSENFHFVFPHDSTIDLAITAVPSFQGIDLDIDAIPLDYFMPSDSLIEGYDVFFLGFPLQIGAGSYSPVCRSGIVSYIDDSRQNFLIEGLAYPGNSGGPIFLKQSIFNFKSNTIGAITEPSFIGIVSRYVTYIEPCVSRHTLRTRIIFEENTGLIQTVPSQYIKALVPK
jgi:hypothetical protein